MCGSPRSLPRAPSCDQGPPSLERGLEAPKLSPPCLPFLLSHCPLQPTSLHSATLAFKALDIRDPEPSPWEVRA